MRLCLVIMPGYRCKAGSPERGWLFRGVLEHGFVQAWRRCANQNHPHVYSAFTMVVA